MLRENLGIILLIAGVIVLAISEFSAKTGNTLLMISAGLVILGLLVYILINRFTEE